MTKKLFGLTLLPVLALAACTAAPPSGPSVVAMPGQGKSWPQFQQDQAFCEQYAQSQLPAPGQAEANSQRNSVATTAAGTAIGAVAGAALGSTSGQMGAGLGIGALVGALGGAAVAGGNTQDAADSLQQRYDIAFAQCMVGHGETIQQPQTPVIVQEPAYYPPSPPPPMYYGP
jgi:outer membrane lipoprotein SlyB